MTLFDLNNLDVAARFPSTRYQGSKHKYAEWIWSCVEDIPFHTVLDAFGGTGCMAHLFKRKGKAVTYNDVLTFNSIIGEALIENDSGKISDADARFILTAQPGTRYPDFIEKTFHDIYFTDDENRWLDMAVTNIRRIENRHKRAVAWFALFQACIIKRPYNLFHRKNLNVRTRDVERSFGNKTTWDTPFETHYRQFIAEANRAVFSNGEVNRSLNADVFDIENQYDLVYIDTPYISGNGVGVDYLEFYHFLEGLVRYDDWGRLIDEDSRHKRLKPAGSDWASPRKIGDAFARLVRQFRDSVLVISYRSDGIPGIDAIADLLAAHHKSVTVHESASMKYVLSTKKTSEVLIVGR